MTVDAFQMIMFDHLGEEVNVILHNGASYWRRLIAVSEGQIKLAALQDQGERYPKTIRQKDIRSFGTKEDGILHEASIYVVCQCGHTLSQHPPHPDHPFAWPCRACGCSEYKEA